MPVSAFHAGAVARLHMLRGQPALILTRPPIEPTPDALARPGEVVHVAHIGRGATWPDRGDELLAGATLQQDGAVVLAFTSVDDAMACAARIARDNRADAPGGAA